MPTVKLRDVELAYRWSGAASGPVLVLSHSLGASGEMWNPQLDALARRFRLLIPDHRGHGNSSVPPGPYSVDQFGQEVLDLLDLLQLQQVLFCGLSLGGMIGMWLAQNAPERVERLVLCNTAAKILDTTLLERRIEVIERDGLAAIADNVIDRWFTERFRASHGQQVAAARNMLLATAPEGYARTSAAVCALDLGDELNSIRCATLVIAGRHDLATPLKWNQAIADAIPHARLTALEAAHLSNIEADEDFNQAVVEFLC